MSNLSPHKNYPHYNYEIKTCNIILEPDDESITYIFSLNGIQYYVDAHITAEKFTEIQIHQQQEDTTEESLEKDMILKFFEEHINTTNNIKNIYELCKLIWKNGINIKTNYEI